jgi:anti-sigma B factor antagonist
MSPFSISEARAGRPAPGSAIVVLVVSGELDCAAAPRLRACISHHLDAGELRLLVDLSAVSFIDSSAIGVLTSATARVNGTGGGLVTVVCAEENARVLRIFDIAAIASLIPVYRTQKEALAALSSGGDSTTREQPRASCLTLELGPSGRRVTEQYAKNAAASLTPDRHSLGAGARRTVDRRA